MSGPEVRSRQAILGIDTCGANGTVALAELNDVAVTVTYLRQIELAGRSASAQLLPAIQSLLSEFATDLRSLRALIVVNGPGSFTGERVGLSTAKGLAHASGVPVMEISRLAVLASLEPERESIALLDAGRNEFYARRGQQEWLASFTEIAAAAAAGQTLVVAEPSVAERLKEWAPRFVGPLDANAALRGAVLRLLSEDFDDPAKLDANYLRRSDGELFARGK